MDLKALLPGSDNFFKYLLSAGMVLMLFALIYPLKKEQDLKLDRIELLTKRNSIQNDIKHLELNIKELKKLQISIQSQLDSLKQINDYRTSKFLDIEKERISLKKFFDDKKSESLKFLYEIDKNNVELEGAESKASEIQNQIWSYFYFRVCFIVLGVLFCISGFRFWIGSTYRDELLKSKEYQDNYKSAYIRFLDYTKKRILLAVIIFIVIAWIVGYVLFQ